MNDQGQNNSNGNIQTVANHLQSTEALGAVFLPSSHTRRFHHNGVQSNGHVASVIHSDNLDFNAEYVEHGHHTTQNGSVGFGLHRLGPDTPDNQSDSNLSDSLANDNGASSVVDEHGVENSSVNMIYLTSNGFPEHASGDFLTGGSSRSAVQGRIPMSQAAAIQVITNNSLSVASPCIGATSIRPQQSNAEAGHPTIMPFSTVPHLNEARHGELLTGGSLRSAVQARIPMSQAAAAQVNTNNGLSVASPYIGATSIRPQQSNASEAGRETIMPISTVPHLNEARHYSSIGSLFSFEVESEQGITRPSYDVLHAKNARQLGQFQSNNQTDLGPDALARPSNLPMGHSSYFHAPFPGQTPQYHQQYHPHFFSQAQASFAAIPYGQQFVQFPNFHDFPLPAPWDYVTGPTSFAPPFSPVYVVPNPGNIPRNMMLGSQAGVQWTYPINWNFNPGTANFHGNFASPYYYDPFLGSNLLMAPAGAHWFYTFEHHMSFGVVNHFPAAPIGFLGPNINDPLPFNPPAFFQERHLAMGLGNQSYLNMEPPVTVGARYNHASEVHNFLQHLHSNAHTNVSRRRQVVIRPPGLREEDIVAQLKIEKFQLPPGAAPEDVDCCCICQEKYGDGDEIGVLDCRHKFHYNCVKRWLGTKNTCPICVRRGLAV